MSQRTVTNVKLPAPLVKWFFEAYPNDPLSLVLSELLQIFHTESLEGPHTVEAEEVLQRMIERLQG